MRRHGGVIVDTRREARTNARDSASGDLTRAPGDCGLFRRFDLPSLESLRTSDHVELSLDEPLSLEAGRGIIGRRVSLCSRRPCGRELIVAEGIVGFNFAESAQSQQ